MRFDADANAIFSSLNGTRQTETVRDRSPTYHRTTSPTLAVSAHLSHLPEETPSCHRIVTLTPYLSLFHAQAQSHLRPHSSACSHVSTRRRGRHVARNACHHCSRFDACILHHLARYGQADQLKFSNSHRVFTPQRLRHAFWSFNPARETHYILRFCSVLRRAQKPTCNEKFSSMIHSTHAGRIRKTKMRFINRKQCPWDWPCLNSFVSGQRIRARRTKHHEVKCEIRRSIFR